MKEKKQGDHIILRLKNNESAIILDWINRQSNLSDAIRYLIEEEIKANQIRDLQEHIPAKRQALSEIGHLQQAAGHTPSASDVDEPIQTPAEDAPGIAQEAVPSAENEKTKKPQTDESRQHRRDQPEEEEEETEDIIDSWMNI